MTSLTDKPSSVSKRAQSATPISSDEAGPFPTQRTYEKLAQPPRLLSPMLKLMGLIDLVLKRLLHHPALTLLALLGIVLAVGLVTSAAFFSQAVDKVILTQELADFTRVTKRPPFSTRVYTFPSSRFPLSVEDVEELASHVAGTLSAEVGLPLTHLGIEVDSGNMLLQPEEGSDLYGQGKTHIDTLSIIYIDGVQEHMEITGGEPMDDTPSEEVLDVWMHARRAEEMGVHIGERFRIGITLVDIPVSIRLKGFWQARDPNDPFWFSDPDSKLDDSLLVRRQDYIRFIEPLLPSRTRLAHWHIILDDSKIVPAEAGHYLSGFERAMAIINKFVPEARLNAPPLDPLESFTERGLTLAILLLGFNIPAFGFLLYFLILTSAIIARWQQRETAVLVSRGMSVSGILGLTLLEELLLFVVGYPLGIGFGMMLARLMGYTTSFLAFIDRDPLPISIQGINFPLTIVALGVALIARLWPTIQAAHQSVVEQERERARPLRGPFWYRYYLDLLLLIPTAYAYRQLADRGSLARLVDEQATDLYRDPLLILVPALFILTAALMTMRLFPPVMRLLDSLASVTPWLTPHMALRQLGRQSQGYINPLLLVIVSLALGVYTLSMAASLDQWLIDRMYYRVGADLTFAPFSESIQESGRVDGEWIPPTGEFLALSGVAAATRVGDYSASVFLSQRDSIRGRFLAIDRLNFPSVAWFRYDFATEALGALMNRLALSPDAILVSQEFLEAHHLNIGDQISLLIAINSELGVSTSFTIAGTYNYFPTVYEEEKPTIIGNLDYLSGFLGVTVPHSIWLRLHAGVAGKTVFENIPKMGIETSHDRDTQALIDQELAKMERVGVFGTLSVGFLAATVMATLGLLIYSYASLQDRLYRFAVLRAVGLMRRQIVGQVVLEYMFLTAYGAAAGAFIGALTSELFVPFFRVTSAKEVPLPPLIPVIAQDSIGQLAITFASLIILLEVVIITLALYQRLVGVLKGHWG